MAKASAGSRAIQAVNFSRPGPNVAGSSATQVRSDQKGYNYGWTIEEDAIGVTLTRGPKAIRVPWSQVVSVEYADA